MRPSSLSSVTGFRFECSKFCWNLMLCYGMDSAEVDSWALSGRVLMLYLTSFGNVILVGMVAGSEIWASLILRLRLLLPQGVQMGQQRLHGTNAELWLVWSWAQDSTINFSKTSTVTVVGKNEHLFLKCCNKSSKKAELLLPMLVYFFLDEAIKIMGNIYSIFLLKHFTLLIFILSILPQFSPLRGSGFSHRLLPAARKCQEATD